MSEAQLPSEGAFDAHESAILATPVASTAAAKRGHKRLATLAGSFLLLIALCGYFYWAMVHDQNTTARIQKELKEDGVQVMFSQAEPKDASFSPFQSLTPTVKIVAPAGNITNALLVRIRDINQDMDLMLNNCPITDDGLASLEGKHNLRWLELRKTKITDEGLKHLRGTDLELLDLSTTKIGDAGLANLEDLRLAEFEDSGSRAADKRHGRRDLASGAFQVTGIPLRRRNQSHSHRDAAPQEQAPGVDHPGRFVTRTHADVRRDHWLDGSPVPLNRCHAASTPDPARPDLNTRVVLAPLCDLKLNRSPSWSRWVSCRSKKPNEANLSSARCQSQ